MWGAPKSPAAVAVDGSVKATQLTVPSSSVTGWAVGDEIVIGQTDLPTPTWANHCERRTINADPSGGNIQWLAPLQYAHTGDDIRVVNLTRNVRVTSAGTDPANNASYVWIQSRPGNAVLSLGEFSHLGSSVVGHPGIEVWSPSWYSMGLSMSSCTVRDGYEGVSFVNMVVASLILTDNVVYGNAAWGMELAGGPTVMGNDFMANGGVGVKLDGVDTALFQANHFVANGVVSVGGGMSGDNIRSAFLNNRFQSNNGPGAYLTWWGSNPGLADITGNSFFRNNGDGMDVQVPNALISSNQFSYNTANGVSFAGSSVTFCNNLANNNGGSGVFAGAISSVISSNTISANASDGIFFRTATDNWVADNVVYGNMYTGMYFEDANDARDFIVNGTIYSNGGWGIYLVGSNQTIQDTRVGYNSVGTSASDTGVEIGIEGNTAVLRGCRINTNGVTGIYTNGINAAGTSLLSLSPVGEPGITRAWGDEVLSDDLTLDYAQPSYPAKALTPRLMRGNGHSATVNSVNAANAVTQLVTIRYDGSLWQVEGSSTGAMGSFGSGNLPSNTAYPPLPAAPQFNLTFTPGPYQPQTDDRVDFLLLAQAGDTNTDKSLLIQSPASGFPNGRSRLTVPSGVTLTLNGRASQAAVMDRATAGSAYYTFIASGTVTMSSAAVSNTDSSGLQFAPSASVSLSSVTFDNLGDNASTRTYITAQEGLTSNTSFYHLTFNNTRNIGATGYSVLVAGTDNNLHWDIMSFAGPKSGDGSGYDPNGRVRWWDATPPSAVNPAVSSGSAIGQLQAAWNSPGDDGMSGTLHNGQYLVFYSTVQTTAQNAISSQAQVVISTTGDIPNSSQSCSIGNLTLGTTYYVRVWAADEWGNTSGQGVLGSGLPYHPAPLPPALTAGVASGEVLLTWTAPATPPLAYLDHYEIQSSTVSSSGPFQALPSQANTAVSYSHTGLLPETTYYYQMRTADAGGTESAWTAAQAYTPDNEPPVAINDLVATPGSAQGTVQLTFTFRGDNGGSKTLEAGGSYRVQYATYTAGVAWSTGSAQAVMPSGSVVPGTVVTQTVGGFTEDGTYYFRMWTVDKWGNASDMDTTAPQASAVPRTQSPRASLSPLDSSAAAYPWTQAFTVSFTKAINPATLTGFQVVKVRDRMGNAVSQSVAGTTAAAGTDSYQFTPTAALDGNSLYEVRITTAVKDAQGNALAQAVSGRYLTFMHHAEENIATGLNGATVDIPAGALAADGYVSVSTPAPTMVSAATGKLISNTGDSLRSPLAGSLAALGTLTEAAVPQALSLPVTVSLPYTDNAAGVVTGTAPPVKSKTLAVYRLDEAHNVWVRMPSTVDPATHRVTASVSFLSSFALIGREDADVTEAVAFPVPWRAGAGIKDITFSGVGQTGKIDIFTPDGLLVKEIPIGTGSQESWDVTNADGRPVATGVYFYRVNASGSSKRGKLVIVR